MEGFLEMAPEANVGTCWGRPVKWITAIAMRLLEAALAKETLIHMAVLDGEARLDEFACHITEGGERPTAGLFLSKGFNICSR